MADREVKKPAQEHPNPDIPLNAPEYRSTAMSWSDRWGLMRFLTILFLMSADLAKRFPLYVSVSELTEEDILQVKSLNVIVAGRHDAGKTETISGLQRAHNEIPTASSAPSRVQAEGTIMTKMYLADHFVRYWDFPGFEHCNQAEYDRFFHAIDGHFLNCQEIPPALMDKPIVLTRRAGITFSDMMHCVLLVVSGVDPLLIAGSLKGQFEKLRVGCKKRDIQIKVVITHASRVSSHQRAQILEAAQLAGGCPDGQVFWIDRYEPTENEANPKKNIELLRVALNCRRACETFAVTHFQRIRNRDTFRAEPDGRVPGGADPDREERKA